MKIFIITLSFCFLQSISSPESEVKPPEQEIKRPIESNMAIVRPNAVRVPLGRILLIRKDDQYCAVKFFDVWWTSEEPFGDRHAIYESYYQGNGSGDFSKRNVQYRKEKLSVGKPKFLWGLGHYSVKGDKDIRCGPIKLWWSSIGFVYFNRSDKDEGDYGFEHAPTKWTDILEVNVFDARLKWYRYDSKRKDMKIPIDQLWEDKERDKKDRQQNP